MSVVESFAIIAEPNRRAILSLLLSSEKIITIGYFRAYTPAVTLL